MKPLNFIAKSFGIAPIRIHQLIRQGVVGFKIKSDCVWVDEKAASDYFKCNPEIYARWKTKYMMAQKKQK